MGRNMEEKRAAGIRDYQILISPVITEKASMHGGAVFRVDRRATKEDIRRAVERIFKVNVVDVRTTNVMGKPKRGMKSTGRRDHYKKAYVTVLEGQTIDLIEGL
jgi:large subunit ribosomal protein L23